MIDVIIEDTRKYPHLFHWDGSIHYKYILPWLNANNYILNPNIVELWEWNGGGTMFETEVIYSPFSNESIEATKDYYNSQGIPSDYLVFHEGMCVSAIRLSNSRIVVLGNTYQELYVFDYIGDWYKEIIRSEYQERYGLE